MELSVDERRTYDAAVQFARENKKVRCSALTDPAVYPSEELPVSVFMAGSPGAGKTEASKELVATFEASMAPGKRILRIDPDELRSEFPGYDGTNAYLFQRPVSSWVDRMLDLAHKQRQSFILDGTLSDYDRARKNIDRCLANNRAVRILYVYQDPLLAWEFVEAREAEEGRRIPPEVFAEQYFAARDVVNRLKRELGPKIAVDLLVKPNDSAARLSKAGIDQIDYHVPERYNRAGLEALIRERVARNPV